MKALSGSDVTGRPAATRPWRRDFIRRSGTRITGFLHELHRLDILCQRTKRRVEEQDQVLS